ncbi:MAG: methyltransferase domain-containing protein, partial [Daejeonella sp.]
WTPLDIARKAADFLATPDAKILDIGSGIGKFCLAGAYYFPDALFFGVEQRYELLVLAEEAKQCTGLLNANFIHANVTQINFSEFDHFYFYNAFYENIDMVNRIDDTIQTSYSLYLYYTQYLLSVLKNKPSGTKIVTFHSSEEEIPLSYKLVDTYNNSLLKMWIKE